MSRPEDFHRTTSDPPPGVLDETSLDGSTKNFHIDFVEEGAPLVITFGFYAVDLARFEFLGRLRKLEQVSGRRLNKLLVRDPSMRWYLGGIEGLGGDVPATIRGLREQIDALKPSAVITVGQSMGAYAAILYGALLGVDKVVAFGTLSAFDRRVWALLHDTRWQPVLDDVEAAGIDIDAYRDLPTILRDPTRPSPDVDLVFGISPGPGAALSAAIGHDGAHAIRFSDDPNVSILPVAHSGHAVVEYFRAQGAITAVLQQRIFGTSLMPLIGEIHQEPWVAWLLENITQGAATEQLAPVMLQNGLTQDQADYFLTRTNLLTDLAHLQDHPPRTTV